MPNPSQEYLIAVAKSTRRKKRNHYYWVSYMTRKAMSDYQRAFQAYEDWGISYNHHRYLTALDCYRGWRNKLNKLEEKRHGRTSKKKKGNSSFRKNKQFTKGVNGSSR